MIINANFVGYLLVICWLFVNALKGWGRHRMRKLKNHPPSYLPNDSRIICEFVGIDLAEEPVSVKYI